MENKTNFSFTHFKDTNQRIFNEAWPIEQAQLRRISLKITEMKPQLKELREEVKFFIENRLCLSDTDQELNEFVDAINTILQTPEILNTVQNPRK